MKFRKQERAQLIYYLRVFDAVTGELLGQLTNITPEGMKLIGVKPAAVGLKISVKMDLPHHNKPDSHITFAAESIWSEKDPCGNYYNTGFKIEKISRENMNIIKKLIKDYYREEIPDEDPLRDMNPPLE
jgi:hypothetical protein